MPKRTVSPLPEQPTLDEIEEQSLVIVTPEEDKNENGSSALPPDVLKELDRLEPEMLKKLKRLVYYTSKVGLSREESCKLVDLDYAFFEKLVSTNRAVATVIEKKDLEYKKDLLYTLSQKARSGDDKLAQWLLERRFPDEFSTKRAGTSDREEDLLFQAISFVQKNGDSQGLINEASGQAMIIRKTPDGGIKTDWTKKLKDMLS